MSESRLDYAAVSSAVAATVALGPASVIDPIRADCELLADWHWFRGFGVDAEYRELYLTFVLARRGVAERPAWAESWVEGAPA